MQESNIQNQQNIQDGNVDKWQETTEPTTTLTTPTEKESIAKMPNIQNGEIESKWIFDESRLPTFPESVYASLPPFLKECVDNAISKDDRAVILLGALTCISACFPNVAGVYDSRESFANLYLFVVANAGMGKGALTLCRELVAPIDDELLEFSEKEYQTYKEQRKEYMGSKNKKELDPPVEPCQLALIIPGNSSAASFQKILADNEGIALLFESEGDTLSNTLKSDYGNYSDALRNAFQHESISFSRRTDRQFCQIKKPRLSTALSGTPEQVSRLIPSPENGLMSRFMFFHIPFKRSIRNVFAIDSIEESKNEKFKQLGEKFKRMRADFLSRGEFTFTLSNFEKLPFIEFLTQTNEECCDDIDNNMQGVVRRLGTIFYRIMMVLTIVRELGKYVPHDRNDTSRTELPCHPEDFETAMAMAKVLAYHSVFIYSRLSAANSKSTAIMPQMGAAEARRMRLYQLLPNAFAKKDYSYTGKALGEPSSTTDKWLKWYIEKGMLERVEQSSYRKVYPTANTNS